MAAVLTEAAATTLFALPIIRRDLMLGQSADTSPPLTQHGIWRFHAPLAVTTLLTLLAQPMTSAALARLPSPRETLAVWPVVFMLLLVMRGWGLALQEITVAQARNPQALPVLRRFAYWVGGVTSGATALIAFSPLLDAYNGFVIHLPPALEPHMRVGVAAGLLMPFLTTLGSLMRGILVAAQQTGAAYRGMGINLAIHGILLALGVLLQLPGMWVAAGAFSLAAVAEYLYLAQQALPLWATGGAETVT